MLGSLSSYLPIPWMCNTFFSFVLLLRHFIAKAFDQRVWFFFLFLLSGRFEPEHYVCLVLSHTRVLSHFVVFLFFFLFGRLYLHSSVTKAIKYVLRKTERLRLELRLDFVCTPLRRWILYLKFITNGRRTTECHWCENSWAGARARAFTRTAERMLEACAPMRMCLCVIDIRQSARL